MLDFDKLFEDYLVNYFKEHESEYENIDELENNLPAIYTEWADTPSDLLGGIAPHQFFSNIKEPKELIDILIGTSLEELNPCSLLMDRIAEVKECAGGLVEIIKGKNYSVKQKMIAVNLLIELGAEHPLDVYIDWISQKNESSGLVELALEILSDSCNEVADKLFPLIETADLQQKLNLAEVLSRAEKDERTFNLLTELFETKQNIPLIAGYMGIYNDERFAPMLYKALNDCNYLEYIEIKNAIERMGGVVEDNRDFSDDEYYKAIKNLK